MVKESCELNYLQLRAVQKTIAELEWVPVRDEKGFLECIASLTTSTYCYLKPVIFDYCK